MIHARTEKSSLFAAAILLVFGFLIYANSFSGEFVYDDHVQILQNSRIKNILDWKSLFLTSNGMLHSRPVINFSLALNYAMSGLNVRSFHLFNLLIHLGNGLLLLGIIRRTLLTERLRAHYGNAALPFAFVCAFLWLVHPLNTHAVTYIIQRTESLMAFFYLMTLYGVIRSSDSGRPWIWRLAAVTACVFGMLTKQVMVTAPVLVLIYDRIFLSSSLQEIRKRKLWLYLGLFFSWILLIPSFMQPEGNMGRSAGLDYTRISPFDYALIQPRVILHYLRTALWPSKLLFDYYWNIERSAIEFLPYIIGLVVLILATGWTLIKKPAAGFLALAYFLILMPTSSFLPIADYINEYRTYLPNAAWITLLVFFIYERFKIYGKALFIVLFVIAGGMLSILTIQRNQVYASEIRLWQDTVNKSPDNNRAHAALAKAYADRGQFSEARNHYQRALELNPNFAKRHFDFASVLAVTGNHEAAVKHYEDALALKPEYAEAHTAMALSLSALKKFGEALVHYQKAIDLNPKFIAAYTNLGILYEQMGQNTNAVDVFEKALELSPQNAMIHYNLGRILTAEKNLDGALEHYQKAILSEPGFAQAYNNLANVYVMKEAFDPAEEAYRKAIALNPKNALAHYNLGRLYLRLGKGESARLHFQTALEIQPELTPAADGLKILEAKKTVS